MNKQKTLYQEAFASPVPLTCQAPQSRRHNPLRTAGSLGRGLPAKARSAFYLFLSTDGKRKKVGSNYIKTYLQCPSFHFWRLLGDLLSSAAYWARCARISESRRSTSCRRWLSSGVKPGEFLAGDRLLLRLLLLISRSWGEALLCGLWVRKVLPETLGPVALLRRVSTPDNRFAEGGTSWVLVVGPRLDNVLRGATGGRSGGLKAVGSTADQNKR